MDGEDREGEIGRQGLCEGKRDAREKEGWICIEGMITHAVCLRMTIHPDTQKVQNGHIGCNASVDFLLVAAHLNPCPGAAQWVGGVEGLTVAGHHYGPCHNIGMISCHALGHCT